MEIVHDNREEWTGGPELPEKLTKERATKLLEEAPALLKKYLAVHGDWREVTSHRNQETAASSSHSWEFTVCECPVCQEAEKLVGHPRTPNG